MDTIFLFYTMSIGQQICLKKTKALGSGDGSASVFRQEAPNLLDPLHRSLLSHWVPLNHHELWEEAKFLETERTHFTASIRKQPIWHVYKFLVTDPGSKFLPYDTI